VISRVWEATMEPCRSPDGVTSVSVRPYYAMLSRVYIALAMGFLVPFKLCMYVYYMPMNTCYLLTYLLTIYSIVVV